MFGEKDTSLIVIDEMVGFQWSMFLVAPTVLHVSAGFILFRFFVFPAGGCGIVMDDVVAGMYSNIALLLLIKFWGI
jgi:Phosphatidylglycerophosphatase A and related proteins